ncbi:MAG: DUF4242 domain-containing protein [Sandaracinaceae bacterium]
MKEMKLYVDTHDRAKGTFPESLTTEQFREFYAKYQKACEEEGVVQLRAHVGLEDGRAFCFNLAPSIEAVRRAHEKVGLPYDSITEVTVATPGDMFFQAAP